MRRPRRLLSIAHSYAVALNRRLAHEMARIGSGEWEVTAVAPRFIKGDLRPITLEASADELCYLEPISAYFTKPIHGMLYSWRLREVLRRSWDFVHCWEEPYIFAGAQVAYWTPPKTPLAFWTAQNISKRYPPPFCWLEQFVLQRCSGWMACGQSIATALLPRGYDRKPYRIMPLGIDLERFSPDERAKADIHSDLGWAKKGAPVVGFMGRFIPEKGVPLLMRVLDRLRSPWRAMFLGGGPLETELREWASRYDDRVRIVTGVKHADIPRHLNAMDLLCAPSQTIPTWREQLGRMSIEAFACGVPVVASDSGEIPYVVKGAGVIVGEKDEAAWASTIEELLDNPAHRSELAVRGLDRARSLYAWPVIARKHLDFFTELIETRTL